MDNYVRDLISTGKIADHDPVVPASASAAHPEPGVSGLPVIFYVLASLELIVAAIVILGAFADQSLELGLIGGSLIVSSLLFFALGSIVQSLKVICYRLKR